MRTCCYVWRYTFCPSSSVYFLSKKRRLIYSKNLADLQCFTSRCSLGPLLTDPNSISWDDYPNDGINRCSFTNFSDGKPVNHGMAGSKIVRLLPMFSTVSEIVPTSDSSDPRPVHGKAQGHHQDTHAHHVHHRPESGSRFAAETYNHQLQNLWYVQQFTPTGIKVNPQCQRYGWISFKLVA